MHSKQKMRHADQDEKSKTVFCTVFNRAFVFFGKSGFPQGKNEQISCPRVSFQKTSKKKSIFNFSVLNFTDLTFFTSFAK